MPAKRFEAARILGERLRARRLDLGLSQYEVAHLSQVDLANYGKLERGVGNPTLMTLLQLAVTLEAEPSALFDGLASESLLPERTRPYSVTDYLRERRLHERSGSPEA